MYKFIYNTWKVLYIKKHVYQLHKSATFTQVRTGWNGDILYDDPEYIFYLMKTIK